MGGVEYLYGTNEERCQTMREGHQQAIVYSTGHGAILHRPRKGAGMDINNSIHPPVTDEVVV